MFSADDIQSRLHERPFTPVRIVTTTNQTYDIYHPDLVLVGRRFLIVGTPSNDNPTQAEQVNRISVIHVTELRDLPVPTAPSIDSSE
jgi:hypothetical protein